MVLSSTQRKEPTSALTQLLHSRARESACQQESPAPKPEECNSSSEADTSLKFSLFFFLRKSEIEKNEMQMDLGCAFFIFLLAAHGTRTSPISTILKNLYHTVLYR
jgi:hypothetical protein